MRRRIVSDNEGEVPLSTTFNQSTKWVLFALPSRARWLRKDKGRGPTVLIICRHHHNQSLLCKPVPKPYARLHPFFVQTNKNLLR
jgi:hypothetical protein